MIAVPDDLPDDVVEDQYCCVDIDAAAWYSVEGGLATEAYVVGSEGAARSKGFAVRRCSS